MSSARWWGTGACRLITPSGTADLWARRRLPVGRPSLPTVIGSTGCRPPLERMISRAAAAMEIENKIKYYSSLNFNVVVFFFLLSKNLLPSKLSSTVCPPTSTVSLVKILKSPLLPVDVVQTPLLELSRTWQRIIMCVISQNLELDRVVVVQHLFKIVYISCR